MFYTFIMIKPDAIRRNLVSEVLWYFKKANYEIVIFDLVNVELNTIYQHYSEKIIEDGDTFKSKVQKAFANKTVIPIILRGSDINIIPNVRKIIGSTDPSKAEKGTIRGDLGCDALQKAMDEMRLCENLIHASDSIEAVKKEINLWLPQYSFIITE